MSTLIFPTATFTPIGADVQSHRASASKYIYLAAVLGSVGLFVIVGFISCFWRRYRRRRLEGKANLITSPSHALDEPHVSPTSDEERLVPTQRSNEEARGSEPMPEEHQSVEETLGDGHISVVSRLKTN